MAMLAAIVSGVIVHVRIFRDFFTFRPRKQLQRSLLDLHNLTGVLALPFHAVITFSGICIVYMILMPAGISALYQQPNTFYDQALSGYSRAPAGVPAPMAALGPMVETGRARWGGAAPAAIRVWNPGNVNAVVKVSRSVGDRVSLADDAAYFDGATGALLHHVPLQPAATTQRFLTGMHFIAFDNWPLRWLYFLAGLAGCVLIATGQLYWLDKRQARHGEKGVRLAAAVTAGTTTGLVIATLAMMVANRLLPMTLPSREFTSREFIEAALFFLVWLANAIHARVAMRPGSRTLVPGAPAMNGDRGAGAGGTVAQRPEHQRLAAACAGARPRCGGRRRHRAAVDGWAGADGGAPAAARRRGTPGPDRSCQRAEARGDGPCQPRLNICCCWAWRCVRKAPSCCSPVPRSATGPSCRGGAATCRPAGANVCASRPGRWWRLAPWPRWRATAPALAWLWALAMMGGGAGGVVHADLAARSWLQAITRGLLAVLRV